MKAIIYAGIGLFSVASVYGLVDYYGSQKNGSINKLYVEEEPVVSPVPDEKTTGMLPVKPTEANPEEANAITTRTKSGKKAGLTKKIKMEDFSRARIPEQVVEEKAKQLPIEKEITIVPQSKSEVLAEKIVIEENENKKISLDMYSRAPLKKRTKPVNKVVVKN